MAVLERIIRSLQAHSQLIGDIVYASGWLAIGVAIAWSLRRKRGAAAALPPARSVGEQLAGLGSQLAENQGASPEPEAAVAQGDAGQPPERRLRPGLAAPRFNPQ